MSGDVMSSIDLTPVVTSLTSAVAPQDIVVVFATGVAVSLGIVLAWTRLQMGLWQIYSCRQGSWLESFF